MTSLATAAPTSPRSSCSLAGPPVGLLKAVGLLPGLLKAVEASAAAGLLLGLLNAAGPARAALALAISRQTGVNLGEATAAGERAGEWCCCTGSSEMTGWTGDVYG